MRTSNDNPVGKVTTIVTTILILSLLWLAGCSALEIKPNPAFMPKTATATDVTTIVVTTPPEVTTMTATPAQEVTTIPQFVVATDALEIRSGSGEHYPNVGYLQAGDRVTVYNRLDTPGQSCQTWAQISTDAGRWVCGDFLEVNSDN